MPLDFCHSAVFHRLRPRVLYVEHQPAPPLNTFIRALWYTNAPAVAHQRERILPSGCVEVILNLGRDFLMDCAETRPDRRDAPALVVGARSVYEIVDTADMASLIGIHFHAGGFAPFVRNRADDFSNRSLPLDDLWSNSAATLRDALREIEDVAERFLFLERHLLRILRDPQPQHPAVEYALKEFGRDSRVGTIEDVSRNLGWSARRFSQVFREQVGFSPKVWCRIRRFQRVVRRLHAGDEIRWAELALDCGYYDQSHFANEFRAFSGIDATTYSALRTRFTNHIRVQ
jgi:AraC-like DNA-binding protein